MDRKLKYKFQLFELIGGNISLENLMEAGKRFGVGPEKKHYKVAISSTTLDLRILHMPS